MNAKTLSAAMSLILSLAAVSAHAEAARTVDLPAVTVRPDANLRAELIANTPFGQRIVNLPAVTVRPDAELHAELVATARIAHRIVDLPTVNVRPSAAQLADRAATMAVAEAQALTEQMAGNLLRETLAATLP